MRERLERRLESLRRANRKALSVFFTAGYPNLDSTVPLALAIAEGGADIVEIGMPFSDPLADGPVIQKSSAVALANGMTLDHALDAVRRLRRKTDVPVVLMGYLNPMIRYGFAEFCRAAGEAGVDGIILPEVPLEEVEFVRGMGMPDGLAGILLVAPSTPESRVAEIDGTSTGFLYCVSLTGVTGASREGLPAGDRTVAFIRRVREISKNPVLVGFGITTPDQACDMAEHADGVIIGSAFIRQLAAGFAPSHITGWVSGFRKALDVRWSG